MEDLQVLYNELHPLLAFSFSDHSSSHSNLPTRSFPRSYSYSEQGKATDIEDNVSVIEDTGDDVSDIEDTTENIAEIKEPEDDVADIQDTGYEAVRVSGGGGRANDDSSSSDDGGCDDRGGNDNVGDDD